MALVVFVIDLSVCVYCVVSNGSKYTHFYIHLETPTMNDVGRGYVGMEFLTADLLN